MASVKAHYDTLLSGVYSWMYGGFEEGIQRNTEFFEKLSLIPSGSGIAVDLGAGCGFQSIPLARAGYKVTALDLSADLLQELTDKARGLDIRAVTDDLMNFQSYISQNAELMVCMTDTLLHLASPSQVVSLFSRVYAALSDRGKFIITFRDLTCELTGLDRFIPLNSCDDLIHTCFLEYETDTVNVHDILHRKINGEWHLSKGVYRKLRLSEKWVTRQLKESGFSDIHSNVENGFVVIVGVK